MGEDRTELIPPQPCLVVDRHDHGTAVRCGVWTVHRALDFFVRFQLGGANPFRLAADDLVPHAILPMMSEPMSGIPENAMLLGHEHWPHAVRPDLQKVAVEVPSADSQDSPEPPQVRHDLVTL